METTRFALETHHRRSVPALTRLAMLAREGAADLTSACSLVEISLLMEDVCADLEEAVALLVSRADGRRGPLASFLKCRQARLEVAADRVNEAAVAADAPAVHRALQRFVSLAGAARTVQRSMAGTNVPGGRDLRACIVRPVRGTLGA